MIVDLSYNQKNIFLAIIIALALGGIVYGVTQICFPPTITTTFTKLETSYIRTTFFETTTSYSSIISTSTKSTCSTMTDIFTITSSITYTENPITITITTLESIVITVTNTSDPVTIFYTLTPNTVTIVSTYTPDPITTTSISTITLPTSKTTKTTNTRTLTTTLYTTTTLTNTYSAITGTGTSSTGPHYSTIVSTTPITTILTHTTTTFIIPIDICILDSIASNITVNGEPLLSLDYRALNVIGGSNPHPWDLWQPNGIIRYYFIEDLTPIRADNYRDVVIGISLIYPVDEKDRNYSTTYATGNIKPIGLETVGLSACIYVTAEGSTEERIMYNEIVVLHYIYIPPDPVTGLGEVGHGYGLCYKTISNSCVEP